MSERLDLIKSLIVPARIIADVGCDHGLIAEYCLRSGLAERIIASDISEKCLQKALDRLGGEKNVEFKCCDGLCYDCDEAIIAGMGGMLIAEIVRKAKAKPATLIVGPHTDHFALRTELLSLGYGIDSDIPIYDRGKFYAVIRATIGGGTTELSGLQLLFGKDCALPSAALTKRLKHLYAVYSVAPRQNADRLKNVIAAMRLQGIAPEPNDIV